MKCPECGTENRPNDKFCASCGTRLPEQAPDPPIKGKESTTKYCAFCGTELPLEASYCDTCGRAVVEGTQAQTHSPHPDTEDVPSSKKGSRRIKPIWIAGLSFLGVLIVAAAIFGGCSWGNRDRASTIPPVASQTPTDSQDAAAYAEASNTPRPSRTPIDTPTPTQIPSPTPTTPPPSDPPPPDPPQPPPPTPLSFTFSPTTGPAGSQVELYLSTAVLDINVYYAGQMIPKSISPDGRVLTVTIPGTAVGRGYFELCGDGGCVQATEPFIVTARVILSNSSWQTVYHVYISPPWESWGDDLLGGTTIPPGISHIFTVPEAGLYDFKATDYYQNEIDIRWSQSVSVQYYWTINTTNVSLTLNNDSGQSVCYVYISPSTQTTWGDDWLGANMLFSGESHVFTVPLGTYDLRAEDCSYNIIDTRWSQYLSGSYIWNIGP